MGKRPTHVKIVKTEPMPAPATQLTVAPEALAPVATEPTHAPAPKTVVKVVYKHRYQDRAKAAGRTDKASRRGNGDWLQRELQAETVGKDGKLDLATFIAILDANGVDYSRWKREGHGWEGRFRMSGSLVLRGIVGKTGVLRTTSATLNVVEIAEGGDEAAQAFLAKWAN
jgi:hypothetical protein